MRRTTSISSRSLSTSGASRALLSIAKATSAMLRAGRWALPAKITSSISPPRSRLAEVSPITQRSASTRFDLPQPFGPTIPVKPGAIASSVRSTNDLNPTRRSRSNCINSPDDGSSPSWGLGLRRREAGQQLFEFLRRRGAGQLAPVDKECRRRIDIELLTRLQTSFDDFVLQGGVGEASVELLLAHAAELCQPGERFAIIGASDPFLLSREERVGKGIVAIRRRTVRDHRRAQGGFVERKVTEHQFGLPGVDPLLLDLGKDVVRKMSAVRTGQRRVFDDRDRGLGVAEDAIVLADLQHGLRVREHQMRGSRLWRSR